MVETIVTIERGGELAGVLFGAVTGVIIARLGLGGLIFTLPTIGLFGVAAASMARERSVATAVLVYAAAIAGAVWLIR